MTAIVYTPGACALPKSQIKGLNPPLISSLKVGNFRESVPLGCSLAGGKADAGASFRRGIYGTKIASGGAPLTLILSSAIGIKVTKAAVIYSLVDRKADSGKSYVYRPHV